MPLQARALMTTKMDRGDVLQRVPLRSVQHNICRMSDRLRRFVADGTCNAANPTRECGATLSLTVEIGESFTL